ncbi:MAG: nicotinate (nicotinamide) nucleotide adenylyltransferase [Candidatus Gottesmanbacteria bacterium]
MKIGLLGGKFNPPHLGHIFIAQQCLDFGGFDEVWFVPNYGQSFHEPVAPVEDRLAMTKCMTLSHTRVSTIEIDNTLDGKTIHLLPFLPKEHTHTFIIGSDQLATFHLWGEYKRLLANLPFIVFPRYGYPNEPIYEHMQVLSHPSLIATNISSSKIRERVRLGLPIENFVPKGVAEYIKEHKLYL